MTEINWSAIREEVLGEFALTALPPTLQLPALPHAVTQFVQKSESTSSTSKELSKILETDTGLTFELLKYVNSSFVGLRSKAGNVQQALSLLGQRQSKIFVVTTGMQAAVRARQSKLINQNSFWNASLQKALFAKEVASLLKADPDTAFSGAVLQDYLLPVLSNDLFDGYLKFIETRDEQPACLTEFERSEFGWDHALAAASLAHRWHLPDDLVCCIVYHHSGLGILKHPVLGRSPVAAVALSAMLPDQLRQHEGGLEKLKLLDEKWGAFNLHQIAETVDEKQEEMSLGVRNDFPLSRRLKSNADEDAGADEGMLAVSVTPS